MPTLVVLVVSALVIARAQQPDTPVFRARTDLVRLDVVVVDADGHAVHGLTAADFRVSDQGRFQRIAQLEEISHEPAGASAPAMNVRQDVADNVASKADRLIVLVLDDLHFQAKTAEVKSMARRVVAGIGAGAALALVTTSGTFGVEPTSDRALMLREIDGFLDKFDPEGRRLASGAMMPVETPLVNAIGEGVQRRGPHDPASFFGDMGTYKTIQDVAKKVRTDAGRRNAFVWITGGMNAPVEDPEFGQPSARDNWYLQALAGLLEAMQKGNVAGYGITTHEFSSGLLRKVADATGGFVTDARSFERDLPRLIDDLDHYYLLGFYPDDPSARGFHTVDVTVNRPGLTVRFRRGYEAGARAPAPRNSGALARLSEGTLPVADLALRMFAAPVPSAGKRPARTAIALEVRVPRGALSEPDGLLRDTLRYEVWAVDLRRKKVVKTIAREVQFVLDRGEAAAHAADPLAYQIHTTLPLAPGRYQLRASATSAKAARGGSVYLETDVPDYAKSPLDIAPIAVTYEGDGRQLPVVRGGPGIGLIPVSVTLDRTFAATDRLRIVTDIVQPATVETEVTIDLLTAAGDRARHLLDKRLLAGDPRALDAGLDLAGLSPGGYRVRVTAQAGAARAEREIAFVVR